MLIASGLLTRVEVLAITDGPYPHALMVDGGRLPGGGMRSRAETPQAAAQRIAAEELGQPPLFGAVLLSQHCGPIPGDDEGRVMMSLLYAVRVDVPGATSWLPLSEVGEGVAFGPGPLLGPGLDRLRDRLLDEAELADALLGPRVTSGQAAPLLVALDPEMSVNSARSKFQRSALYRPTGALRAEGQRGRPSEFYVRTG